MNIYLEEFYSSKEKERFKIVKAIERQLHEKKIILYGAGAIGKTLKTVFDKLDLNVEFFVDKKYKEIIEMEGIQVKDPQELRQVNSNDFLVIICVASDVILHYQKEIHMLLEEYCPLAEKIESGRQLAYLLNYYLCSKEVENGKRLDLTECINCGYEARGCEICDDYLRKQNCTLSDEISYKKREFEHFFGYILGNYCTLRCKNCNEMIPFHNERSFVDKEEVLRDCKHLIASCTFLPCMELVGGEPFLYPELEELLRELLKIKNLGYIKIFTNGTVVPGDSLCKILRNERIVINLSNYTEAVRGELLSRIYKTKEKFEQAGISYISSYAKTWLNFNFENKGRSKEELQYNFAHCNSANCHRLYRGVLYRCHHQYAGVRLGKFDIKESDVIRIHDYTIEELRKKCDEFEEISYIDACSYCNWPFDVEEVPAAEQVK